ncbi:MAG: ArsR/SmtB family transcription factor [Candidatus Helarchaeota archaeon]
MNLDLEEQQLKTLLACKGNTLNINKYLNEINAFRNKVENNADFNFVLNINRILSDKNRFLIIQLLKNKQDLCSCEFSVALGLTQPTINHHLKKLEDSGLIKKYWKGKFIHYNLNKSIIEKYYKTIKELLE